MPGLAIDPDAPWWVNAVLQVALIVGAVWIATRTTRKKVDAQADDIKAVRHQVQNSHRTNLRDDIDGTTEQVAQLGVAVGRLADSVEGLREDVGGLHSETRDLRKDVTGVRDDARRDRRRIAELEQRCD